MGTSRDNPPPATLPDPERLAALIPAQASGCVVAFSGGLDSTVLLHLATRCGHPVRAIHIHHGLQAAADHWAEHCQDVCRRFGVHLSLVHVDPVRGGQGLEAAARDARYAALGARLKDAECLLTAHHADDQLETLLLRLVRGTGPDGLAGIPALRRFNRGWLARPLLAFPRERLRDYARCHDLGWVEDPANADLTQDRNYLRHRVIPALQSRWRGVAGQAARLARHAGQQRDLMQGLVRRHRSQWPGPVDGPLPLAALRDSDARMRPALLREWLREGGLVMPPEARLEAGLEMLLEAGADRRPALVWGDHQVRRHRGWLYRLPWPLPDAPASRAADGDGEIPWGSLGRVSMAPGSGAGLEIRAPRLGERIAMPRRPTKPLKALLREAGVLPWWRQRLPLLAQPGGAVLAMPGLGVTRAGLAAWGRDGFEPRWMPRPRPDGPDWAWLRPPA